MGLVDLSLVSQEPAYWGWLRTLIIDDIESLVRLSNPELGLSNPTSTETAEYILQRIAGALEFTDTPALLQAANDLLANCQNGLPQLEPLLRFREQTMGFGGKIPKETAQAVGLALQEEIMSVSASLDALFASPDGFQENLIGLATRLEERQQTMQFLELTRSTELMSQSSSRLRQIAQGDQLTRSDLLKAIEPLAELEGSLADSLFYGEQSIVSGIGPSFSRETLAAISVPLEEEIALLRHLLLETSSQETKEHLKPGLEKMAGVFRVLGHDLAADHMNRLAKSADQKLATSHIADALAQAEILVFGLLTHHPTLPEWESSASNHEETKQETNPAWEQAGLLVERWVKRSHPEDAIQAIRLLRGLDGLSSHAQHISAGVQKILEGCFTSLRTPGVPEKVVVLKGFRLLLALRFNGDVTSTQVESMQAQLEQVASSAAKKSIASTAQKKPTSEQEEKHTPVTNPLPVEQKIATGHGLFNWESELDAETKIAFWHFSSTHLSELKNSESPFFWKVMGWMEASIAMTAGEAHPLRKSISDAREKRQITAETIDFLEWLRNGVQEFQKSQLEKALPLMEAYTAEARQAMSAGNINHARRLLLAQANLLNEHGFCAGDA